MVSCQTCYINIYCKLTEWKVRIEEMTIFIYPVFLNGFLNELAQKLKQNTVSITINRVILTIQVSWLNHKAVNGLLSGPVTTWDKSLPL